MRTAHPESRRQNGRPADGQRGFTLIELMIALLIGLFLLGALMTIVQTNRTVFGDQNKMAQLQDAERMALTMLSDVIQSAGYFPAPYTTPLGVVGNTLASSLPATGSFAAGQAIFGASAFNAGGDQIAVRYMTAPLDGIVNCSGDQNRTAGNLPYINTFEVLNGQLICVLNVNGAVSNFTLVGDGTTIVVNNISFLYGVSSLGTSNSVDTYMTAQQVNGAGLWSSVLSVMVRAAFPLVSPSLKMPPPFL